MPPIMKNYLSRFLIGLDNSEADQSLIGYICRLSRLIQVDKVYFVHINPNLELPQEISEKYSELLSPVDEGIRQNIERKIQQQAGACGLDYEIIVKEGDSVKDLLKLGKIKQVDALIFGKKPVNEGSGLIPSKIASRSPFSVIMVPTPLPDGYDIRKVMIASDFSDYATLALEQALAITERSGGKIVVHHVYEVPIGYYKTGKSFEEFASIMKRHAENDMKKFLHSFSYALHRITTEYTLRLKTRIGDLLWKTADEKGVDLVIIGSKGRTAASSMLMGSVADSTLHQDFKHPVLVIKKPKENMSFLEALLKV
jgi:nucleotide-binding universal stress UspA family protein